MTAKPQDFDRIWDAGVAGRLATDYHVVIDGRDEKFYQPQ
jgi:hypothetical protein